MVRIYKTSEPPLLGASDQYHVYNALDCAITLEVFEVLIPKLDEVTSKTYELERSLQGPVLEMNMRGISIDTQARDDLIAELSEKIKFLEEALDEILYEGLGLEINAASPKQLCTLFYEVLALPVIRSFKTKAPTVDIKALEKLRGYFHAAPIVNHILAIRDLSKQRQMLRTSIDGDGKIRTSISIAGTDTGRFSSYASSFGSGTNLQTVSEKLRRVFVAEPGMKFAYIDLEQAESRAVGAIEWNLFHDGTYLDVCECLTEDHEVLTETGWEYIDEKPNKIAVWDKATKNITFEKPYRWNEGFTEELVYFEGQFFSQLCTPGHTMPDGQKAITARNKACCVYPLGGTLIGGANPISVEEARFIAAFQADGTRDSQGKTHFSFIKERKISRMRNLLTKLGYAYSEYNLKTGAVRFYIKKASCKNWPKQAGAYLLSWNKAALSAYLHEQEFWDGSCTTDTTAFAVYTADAIHADWLKTIAHLCDRAATVTTYKGHHKRVAIKSRNTTQTRSMTKRNYSCPPTKVYCPTVSTGYFLVRRNGKISISGNSSDLHTASARMCWPYLDWTGDLKKDKAVAKQIFYRDVDYRQGSKKLSHASNYLGKPPEVSKQTGIPLDLVKGFQLSYFRAFPAHAKWHNWVQQKVYRDGWITTFMGRRRYFFGRRWDNDTIKAATAYEPQSAIADYLSEGILRVWHANICQILLQVHDAILIQYPEELEDEIVPRVKALLEVEVPLLYDRTLVIPTEAMVGWNWGKVETNKDGSVKSNPNGLKVYEGSDSRKRVIERGFLDKKFSES